MMKVKVLFVLCLPAIFWMCGTKKPPEKLTTLASWKIDYEDPSIQNHVKGDAYEGSYMTSCDGQNMFCHGISYVLPDSSAGKFVRVCFDFYARLKKRRFGQSFVISIQNQDNVFLWHSVDINDYTLKKEKWVHIVDSIQFFNDGKQTKDADLRVFGYNAYHKAALDIDNMNVTIKMLKEN